MRTRVFFFSTTSHVCSQRPFPRQHLLLCPIVLCAAVSLMSRVLRESEISALQVLDSSHICGPCHSLTSQNFATDIVEHTELHVDTLQLCGRRFPRLWLPFLQVVCPKLATLAHNYGQIQSALAGRKLHAGNHSQFTNREFSDVRPLFD